MGRQGKLHSSPFHVESIRYLYAVEKEGERATQNMPGQKFECPYMNQRNICTLWNSGETECRPGHCIYKQGKGIKVSCTDCAYFYGGWCSHRLRTGKEKCSIEEALRCCYFDKESNTEEFKERRKYSERYALTKQLEKNGSLRKYRHRIQHLKALQVQFSNEENGTETKLMIENEIQKCSKNVRTFIKMNKSTIDRLNSLGGIVPENELIELNQE